jgi:hypothetical protein
MQAREKLEMLFFEKQVEICEKRIWHFIEELTFWLSELKASKPNLSFQFEDSVQVLLFDHENRLFCVEKQTFIEDNPKCFQLPMSFFYTEGNSYLLESIYSEINLQLHKITKISFKLSVEFKLNIEVEIEQQIQNFNEELNLTDASILLNNLVLEKERKMIEITNKLYPKFRNLRINKKVDGFTFYCPYAVELYSSNKSLNSKHNVKRGMPFRKILIFGSYLSFKKLEYKQQTHKLKTYFAHADQQASYTLHTIYTHPQLTKNEILFLENANLILRAEFMFNCG